VAVKTVAIVQARTTSTRLPGKVLSDIEGLPMLAHVLRRARASGVDDVVVASTMNAADDPVVEIARSEGARWFRGDEYDVLARYAGAARDAGAEVVVRITADCPLLDPEVLDRVVEGLDADADYASNVLDRTFPVGLDVEAMRRETLDRIDVLARSPQAREHVTWFLREERPELFVRRSIVDDANNSDLRFTVDTDEDLEVVRRLYRELRLLEAPRSYRDVVAYARMSGIGVTPAG
jgi:spore coat polysaccharide biosynthesis protein SpsF